MPSNAPKLHLRAGDITLKELVQVSKAYWDRGIVDDKRARQIDILSAKVTARVNLEFDPKDKKYHQVGRSVKLQFVVSSDPISYKKKDNIRIHRFPVTFLFYDWDKGFDSPVRWRCGSTIKPQFSKPIPDNATDSQKEAVRAENLKKEEANIRNGLDMYFFYNLMYVLNEYQLLYGVNYASRSPKIRNAFEVPAFCKHAWFVVNKILIYMLSDRGREYISKKVFPNDPRE